MKEYKCQPSSSVLCYCVLSWHQQVLLGPQYTDVINKQNHSATVAIATVQVLEC